MDLLAALALVLVLEGLAVAVFARSIPEIMAEMKRLDSDRLRVLGLVTMVLGIVAYLVIRGGI